MLADDRVVIHKEQEEWKETDVNQLWMFISLAGTIVKIGVKVADEHGTNIKAVGEPLTVRQAGLTVVHCTNASRAPLRALVTCL